VYYNEKGDKAKADKIKMKIEQAWTMLKKWLENVSFRKNMSALIKFLIPHALPPSPS